MWKDRLVKWLEEDIISKGLIRHIFNWYEVFTVSKGKDLKWRWNAAYQLSRHRDKGRDDPTKSAAIRELMELILFNLVDQKFRFEAFIVAVRWAELLTRKSNYK